MTFRLIPVVAIAIFAAAPAAAQTPLVNAARNSGQVGERYDGYMGLVGPASAALRSQVSTINIRRRSLYSNLASGRGAMAQDVGLTAGCQLLSRVQAGHAYMLADGRWRRRGPGQPAPIPDYCG